MCTPCLTHVDKSFFSDFGEESDDCYFFCNMCATGFLGARQPGIDPCRRLVHSYATVG